MGKVDIAALRRQAQETSKLDDRPTAVKGAYEPVGKVDIAAIRARAQAPSNGLKPPQSISSQETIGATGRSSDQSEEQRSLPHRSAPFSTSEHMSSLPKPKVANRFGSSTSSFTGTKAPTPGSFGLESKATSNAPPTGVGRTFADQGGKTPAQIWAEKKARERGQSGASDNSPPAPMTRQSSGGQEWKSGYGGKSWAPVQTTRTGQSASSLDQQRTGQEDETPDQSNLPSTGGIEALRDRFKGAPPMGASNLGSAPSPPPLDTSSKPNAGRGIPIPGLPTRPSQRQEESDASRMPTPPPQPPRSPTPPTPPAMESGSPIRVAMPVGRGHNDQDIENAREEQFSPPPSMPARSIAQAIPHEEDLTEEPASHDPARGADEATAAATFGTGSVAEAAYPDTSGAGERALVQFDYEKAEDNELELKEGEYVTNIEKVDEDWWMGQNPRGETGLFPSNYVEIVHDEEDADRPVTHEAEQELEPEQHHADSSAAAEDHTATALYDYEAAEGNELSFPEGAKITGLVSHTFP